MTISETICFHRFYFGLGGNGYLDLNTRRDGLPRVPQDQETTR